MDKSKLKDLAPTIILVGGAILVLRVLSGWAEKLTPDPVDPEEKKQEKDIERQERGTLDETKRTTTGKNLKRYDSDTALRNRVTAIKVALDEFPSVNQTTLQNCLIATKSDADYRFMSQVFGTAFDLRPTQLNNKNLTEWLNSRMSSYSKNRVNQSWKTNKKYPQQITFLWA